MINLTKEDTTLFEDDLELSVENFLAWSYGYISYANRFYNEKTLPHYFAKDVLIFLEKGPDAWTFVFWLRGYLENVEVEEFKIYKGYIKLINHLSSFV